MRVIVLPGGLTCRQLPERPRPAKLSVDECIYLGLEWAKIDLATRQAEWESEAASMPVYDLSRECKEGDVVDVELSAEFFYPKFETEEEWREAEYESRRELPNRKRIIAVPIDRKQALTEIMHADEKDGLYDTGKSSEDFDMVIYDAAVDYCNANHRGNDRTYIKTHEAFIAGVKWIQSLNKTK